MDSTQVSLSLENATNLFETQATAINIGFTFICGVLVVLMQLGFAMVESGLNSYKHTANILFKNMADLCITAIMYYFIGFHIMFPDKAGSSYFSLPSEAGVTWFYQMAFAATAATIVSGAVAGRMKFRAYLLFSAFLGGIVYPIVGRFCWSERAFFGSESLEVRWDLLSAPFHDLAGSVVVHAVGGAAALAAIIVLRPRNTRFFNPGFVGHHNLVYALLGTMLLWVGWYGFNTGSIGELVSTDISTAIAQGGEVSSKEEVFSKVIQNTTLGGAAGALAAMVVGLIPYRRKLNLKAAMNGALGGLVAITANCDITTASEALFIGTFAGGLVILGEMGLEELKLDDTVGAIPVHGLCGIWGGLAAGIFGDGTHFGAQLLSTVLIVVSVFGIMYLFFKGLKILNWLEVSQAEEKQGLDQSEHGLDAYIPSPKGN